MIKGYLESVQPKRASVIKLAKYLCLWRWELDWHIELDIIRLDCIIELSTGEIKPYDIIFSHSISNIQSTVWWVVNLTYLIKAFCISHFSWLLLSRDIKTRSDSCVTREISCSVLATWYQARDHMSNIIHHDRYYLYIICVEIHWIVRYGKLHCLICSGLASSNSLLLPVFWRRASP